MKLSVTLSMMILGLSFQTLAQTKALPNVQPPKELTMGDFSEGTITRLSTQDVQQFIPWAQNAQNLLSKALRDAKTMPLKERLPFIEKSIQSVVRNSGSKNYQMFMRFALNRGLLLKEELKKETDMSNIGAKENALDILVKSIEIALEYYESDLSFQKRAQAGNDAVNLQYAAFGYTFGKKMIPVVQNVIDASAEMRLLYKVFEMSNWDFSKDPDANNFSDQIVDIFDRLQSMPEEPSKDDLINLARIRTLLKSTESVDKIGPILKDVVAQHIVEAEEAKKKEAEEIIRRRNEEALADQQALDANRLQEERNYKNSLVPVVGQLGADLVGFWETDNCKNCFVEIRVNSKGKLEGNMWPWGTYESSFSSGFKSVELLGNDQFKFQGATFKKDGTRFISIVKTDYSVVNFTNKLGQQDNYSIAKLKADLVGTWSTSNCTKCIVSVRVNAQGNLEANMWPWDTYASSFSGGYRPIEIKANGTFIFRDAVFHRNGSGFKTVQFNNKSVSTFVQNLGRPDSASMEATKNNLVGFWKTSNCDNCFVDIRLDSKGQLEGNMWPWGTYSSSFSDGYQPIEILGADVFMFRDGFFTKNENTYHSLGKNTNSVVTFVTKYSTSSMGQINLKKDLVGKWATSNCSNCFVDIRINSKGELEGDMWPWGTYTSSFSNGYQPIEIKSANIFTFRGGVFIKNGSRYDTIEFASNSVDKFTSKVNSSN